MLVMRTIKDPPDSVSGFTAGTYAALCELTQSGYIIPEMERVQITSQVERTEPDELATEEPDEVYTKHDSDTIEEASGTGYDPGELSSMEGEDTGDMETELEHNMDTSDDDVNLVATTTGHDDQEDTSESLGKGDPSIRHNETDELDIQWVKVITT